MAAPVSFSRWLCIATLLHFLRFALRIANLYRGLPPFAFVDDTFKGRILEREDVMPFIPQIRFAIVARVDRVAALKHLYQ